MVPSFIGQSIQNLAKFFIGSMGISEGTSLWMSAAILAVVCSAVSVGVFALFWKYKGKILRGNEVKLANIISPRLPRLGNFLATLRLPTPKIRFSLSGWKGIAGSIGMVAVGFVGAFSLVIATTDDTPVFPEAGAAYSLPLTFGTPLEPDSVTPEEPSQTLQLNLGDDSRIDKLTFENMDLGKAGLTKCIELTYATTGVATTAFLNTSKISFTGVSAPTFDMSNSHIHNMDLAGKVDGHTYGPTVVSTTPDVVVNSDRGAGTFTAKDSKVDRIVLSMTGSAGPTIGEVEFKNVNCKVGAISLTNIKAGSFTQDNTSKVGAGTGINSASYVVNNDVKIFSGTSNLVDTPISIK